MEIMEIDDALRLGLSVFGLAIFIPKPKMMSSSDDAIVFMVERI